MSNLTPEDVDQLVTLVHLALTDLHSDREKILQFDEKEYAAQTGEDGTAAKTRMLKKVDDAIYLLNETYSHLETGR